MRTATTVTRTAVALAAAGAVLIPVGAAHAAAPPADPALAHRAMDAMTAAAAARPDGGTAPGVRAQALLGTPGTLLDAIGDGPPAPDLQAITAAASDDGRFNVLIRLDTNALIDGDSVFSWVNADGNAATGSPVFGGADVAVAVIGAYGTDTIAFFRWDGADMTVRPLPAGLAGSPSGETDVFWSAPMAGLGIAAGTTVTAEFSSMYSGLADNYFDWAPEPGGAPLTYTVPAPAAPPPAPAPAPTAGTPTPGGGAVVTATPTLRVNGLTASRRGRTLTVRTAWQGDPARQTRYRLELRARGTSRTLTGAAPAGQPLVRRVRLPLAWRGRAVQV
jgi:hypothetical protein